MVTSASSTSLVKTYASQHQAPSTSTTITTLTPSSSTFVPVLALEGAPLQNLDLPRSDLVNLFNNHAFNSTRNLIILATPPSPSVATPCQDEGGSVQYSTVLYCPQEPRDEQAHDTSKTSHTTSTTTTTTSYTSTTSTHTPITPGHRHRPPDLPGSGQPKVQHSEVCVRFV